MSRLEITYDGKTLLSHDVDELSLDEAPGYVELRAKFQPEAYEYIGPTGTFLDGLVELN